MTTIERDQLPSIICTPWCEDQHGHPDCFHPDDQTCWGPAEYLELELEPILVETGHRFPARLGVMPHRQRGGGPMDCYLYVGLPKYNVDTSAHLTAAEARSLAQALISVAETMEGTESG